MPVLSELITKIVADNSSFDRATKTSDDRLKDFGKRADVVGEKLTTFGKNMSLFVTAPILALGTSFVTAASNAEEVNSKFQVVFSDISAAAEASAQNLVDNFGLSEVAAKDLEGKTGDLLTGFGFTQTAALNLAGQVGELAVDLASFTNVEGGAAEAARAITSAMLGENEAVKKLGVAILKADIDAQILADTQAGLTFETERQAKASAVLSLVMGQSANAQGDYARTSESFANQLRLLGERVNDLAVAFGNELLPTATRMITKLVDLVEGFTALDSGTKRTIITISGIGAATGPALLALGTLSKLVGFLAANPLVLAGAGVLALSAAMVILTPKAQTMARWVEELVKDTEELAEETEEATVTAEDQAAVLGDMTAVLAAVSGAYKELVENQEQLNVAMVEGEGKTERSAKLLNESNAATEAAITARRTQLAVIGKELSAEEELNIKIEAREKLLQQFATETMDMTGEAMQGHVAELQGWRAELEDLPEAVRRLQEAEAAANEARIKGLAEQKAARDEFQAQEMENADARERRRNEEHESEIVNSVAIREQRLADIKSWDEGQSKSEEMRLAAIEEERDRRLAQADEMLNIADTLTSGLDTLWQESFDNRSLRGQMAHDAEMARIEDEVNNEVEKNRLLGVEKDRWEEEKRKLAFEEAIRTKAAALFDIGIGTAVGIVNSLAKGGPVGIALAAIIGGLAAAQAALVIAKPLPALAEGGVFRGPAIIGEQGPEIAIPLRDDVLSRVGESIVGALGGQDDVPVQVSVRIDENVLAEVVTRGIRDRHILVDKRAVVE